MRSSPGSKLTWTANWWPNEVGRVNWIISGQSSSDGVSAAAGIVLGSRGAGEQGLRTEEERLRAPGGFQGLRATNRLAKGDKTELDFERIALQSENDDLLRELEQALADKAEAEKQSVEDVRGCRRRSS